MYSYKAMLLISYVWLITLDRASNNIASVYAERAGGDIGTWRTL